MELTVKGDLQKVEKPKLKDIVATIVNMTTWNNEYPVQVSQIYNQRKNRIYIIISQIEP
jgi:hypothetical protein